MKSGDVELSVWNGRFVYVRTLRPLVRTIPQ